MAKKLSTFFKFNRRFLIAVIALLEIAAIFCAVTFSWIEVNNNATLDDNKSTVSAGEGIIFTDLNGDMISSLTLNTANLVECSSVDGRNFFFPTSESKVTAVTDAEGQTTSYNDSMVYRAGTDADLEAGKYISVDFNVLSYAAADLYISESSSVTCSNDNLLKSVRVSLNFNDGEAPKVFCPALSSGEELKTERPITSIDDKGHGTDTSLEVLSFKDYTPNTAKKIKNFTYGQSKRVTLSIWLEGTYSEFNSTYITGEESITVNLTLTSSSADSKKVKFVDYSPNTWVKKPSVNGQDIIMYAVDPSNENNRYQLTRINDKTYIGDIPNDLDDVYFMRDDPSVGEDSYHVWSKDDNTDVMSNSNMDIPTYYAIGRGIGENSSTPVDKYNYGYWVKKAAPNLFEIILLDKSNVLENADTTANNTPSLYMYGLANYGFKNSHALNHIAPWPGMHMEHIGTIDDSTGSKVYRLLIPADSETIQFNSGSDSAKSPTYDLSNLAANDKTTKLQIRVYKDAGTFKIEKFDYTLVYKPVS